MSNMHMVDLNTNSMYLFTIPQAVSYFRSVIPFRILALLLCFTSDLRTWHDAGKTFIACVTKTLIGNC